MQTSSTAPTSPPLPSLHQRDVSIRRKFAIGDSGAAWYYRLLLMYCRRCTRRRHCWYASYRVRDENMMGDALADLGEIGIDSVDLSDVRTYHTTTTEAADMRWCAKWTTKSFKRRQKQRSTE